MKKNTPDKQNHWATLGVVAPYFRRHEKRLVLGTAALITVDFMQLWIPRIIKRAVDDLQHGTATSHGLLTYGAYILLLAVGIGSLRFLWRYMLLGFSRLLEMQLRNQLVGHCLTLDRSFFHRNTTGEIMALATNDLSSVQLASGMGLVAAIDAVVMSIAAMAFMAYISPTLTAIAVIPLPFLALSTRFLSSRLHRRFRWVQEQFSHLTEFARSTISSIRLIKAYNQEQAQAARFDHMGQEYVQGNLKVAIVHGILSPISILISNTCMLLVIFFGGRMTITGQITAGDFVAFINYLLMLAWPMMAMGWVANLFQRGITSLQRIQHLLNETPSLSNPPAPHPPFPIAGSIRIRNLSFSYPHQSKPALESVNLDIRPGLTGIVGKTGSGKTTLCHLIARLYPVADQCIAIGGVDVNQMTTAQVRSAIAYVPQDVIVFSDTIAFNIAMGKPDATQAEIEQVARAAAIHDEIAAMKEGYQTRIGERGVKLSGGQRQRLAIARALLLDRPIIIMDDALSAVDMETEHAIIRSISGYLSHRTCIIVSHRVAPLAEAQEIVVMDRGRIVAQGDHRQLLEKSRFYSTIYRQQTSFLQLDGPTP